MPRVTINQMRAAFAPGKPKRGRGRPSAAQLAQEEADDWRVAVRAALADLGLLDGDDAGAAQETYSDRLGPFPEAADRFALEDLPDLPEHHAT